MLAYEIFMKTEQTPSAYEGHFIKLKDQENAGKWTLTLDCFDKSHYFFYNMFL